MATPASNMSNLWVKKCNVDVKPGKTIRDALFWSGGAHTNYVSAALVRYIMGATCVGTAAAIADYLMAETAGS